MPPEPMQRKPSTPFRARYSRPLHANLPYRRADPRGPARGSVLRRRRL